jgi:rhamnopyranosyl-N-acetylglucosaminyl-diphospho-decaprenol beta-1,3/1,4-galactofuranosyltransferase
VLRKSLTALIDQSRPLDAIFVVDNASSDGTADMVVREFPTVQLIRLPENTGAAGGFAAGLDLAVVQGYDWVWLFNDDDVAVPEALGLLLGSAEDLPVRTGIVACARRGADGESHPLGAKWKGRQVVIRSADDSGQPLPVDVVAFSGALVSTDAVRTVGVPRADFFMMVEELEYCLRVRRAGWGIYVLPRVLATSHNLGSVGMAAPWRGYYQTRNQLAMSLERRSVRELFWWSVRTAKFCVGAIRVGDRPLARIRLRTLGAWHAVRRVSGRTITPPVSHVD